MKMKEYP